MVYTATTRSRTKRMSFKACQREQNFKLFVLRNSYASLAEDVQIFVEDGTMATSDIRHLSSCVTAKSER